MGSEILTLFFHSEREPGFYEVLSYPVSEMSGSTPLELADEIATITNSVDWRISCRRPVDTGDYIDIGGKAYSYTDGTKGEPLIVWPHLGIEEV